MWQCFSVEKHCHTALTVSSLNFELPSHATPPLSLRIKLLFNLTSNLGAGTSAESAFWNRQVWQCFSTEKHCHTAFALSSLNFDLRLMQCLHCHYMSSFYSTSQPILMLEPVLNLHSGIAECGSVVVEVLFISRFRLQPLMGTCQERPDMYLSNYLV